MRTQKTVTPILLLAWDYIKFNSIIDPSNDSHEHDR